MTRPLFVDHAAVLGGAELSLLDIAAEYAADGAVALFDTGPFSESLTLRGVTVHHMAGATALGAVKKASLLPSLGAVRASVRLARALATLAAPYDLLYANSPKSFLVSALASVLARKPVVWHLRDILNRQHFSAANVRALIVVANARAARVVANSRATADAFVAAGGRASLVEVVHNGIDPAPFDMLGADARTAVREELNIPLDAFVVGNFSRLHPWKGQRVFLDALGQTDDVHGLVVGGALFSREDTYEAELRQRAGAAPFAGRVQLLGMRADVPRLLTACDVVAHTSVLPEPFGRVIVEAMLAGCPVIASDDGGVREIIVDGRTGVLVPPGDAAALLTAIRALQNDPERRRALAQAGREHARAAFSRSNMLAGVARVIDAVSAAPADAGTARRA